MKTSCIVILVLISFCAQAQKDLMFVFLNTNPEKKELSKEETDALMKAHLENIQRLANEDKLIIAGPFNGGGGIFVLNTGSKEAAWEWLNTDAAIRADRWKIEMYLFHPLTGDICKAASGAEMLQYDFVRFVPNLTKFNIQQESDLMRSHLDYVKALSNTGNVIGSGYFSDRAGSIVVMQGEVEKKIFEADPAVKGTLFELEYKKLYIAKGSFCEN